MAVGKLIGDDMVNVDVDGSIGGCITDVVHMEGCMNVGALSSDLVSITLLR